MILNQRRILQSNRMQIPENKPRKFLFYKLGDTTVEAWAKIDWH